MDQIKSFVKEFIEFSREIYGDNFIPLHRPVFQGNEKKYLNECIDSNFVSSVGEKVNEFESKVAEFTQCKYAVATVNGTSALHVAIQLSGVKREDEVLTQALTFIATCNAISYAGASPVFIDVDMDTMGMSPVSLKNFLESNAEIRDGHCFNKYTGKRISACIPMHTFGFPCRIKEIKIICNEWNISLVEDCAESMGSYVDNMHTGTFGKMSILSFNGNKLITTGGGGMIITNNEKLAKEAKHITTTSKIPHPYKFIHDEIGYNYRLPNLNAALGCAQMELLNDFLAIKSDVKELWKNFFQDHDIKFVEPLNTYTANNWLNTIVFKTNADRDYFLNSTNKNGIMTRPIWTLMPKLTMFKNFQSDGLKNSQELENLVVNIPSSVPDESLSKL